MTQAVPATSALASAICAPFCIARPCQATKAPFSVRVVTEPRQLHGALKRAIRRRNTMSRTSLPSFQAPLVVIILTHNSAATVQETLDSIAQQESAPMELVATSTDGTFALVGRWTRQHADRLIRIELPSTPNILGMCGNRARGIAAAAGEWVGGILLLPFEIARYMACARDSNAAKVVGLVRTFARDADGARQFGQLLPTPKHRVELALIGPGALGRCALKAVGGIDLAVAHLDDWPLWMRMLAFGMRFQVLEESLVVYRASAGSISTKRLAVKKNPRHLEDLAVFYERHQKQRLSPLKYIDRAIEVFRRQLLAVVSMSFSIMMPAQWVGHGYFWQASFLTTTVGAANCVAIQVLIARYGIHGAVRSSLGCYLLSIGTNRYLIAMCDSRTRKAV